MGSLKEPPPVKLFIAVIAASEAVCLRTEPVLIEQFGPFDYVSEYIPFNFTEYYKEEMGEHLLRRFYSFERLIAPDSLSDIKLWTNALELSISSPNRSINLDPGYLNGAKMILATTKDYSHRICLGKGIFGEVTLRYRKGSYDPFDYTYRDYATPEYLKILNHIRSLYMKQINLLN